MAFGICFGVLASSAFGGFDEGQAAYKAGDYATAISELKPLADQGGASAQYILGVMYDNGEGVPQDYAEAKRWYRKAAEQGHAAAQCSLGLMYSDSGRGDRNDGEAVKWYRRAAEQGNADAQASLGWAYIVGVGVDENAARAVYWLAKSVQQGNLQARVYIDNNLDRLKEKRAAKPQVSVLSDPSAKGKVVKVLSKDTSVYILDTQKGWNMVFIPDGYTLGWTQASTLKSPPKPVTTASENSTTSSVYPARPAARPGVLSCNTRCVNGDCYRTYSNGKKVRFQAQMRMNPFTNQMEFDSGGC